jgi:ABC-2 type transport system permease protein
VPAIMGASVAADVIKQANYSIMTAVWFALFFLGGFFLYSAMCAALGAMVSTEQEAQQIQMFVIMPLILSFMFLFFAMKAPNDPLVVAVSMFPFSAPIIMITRIVVQTPPVWQILTSLALMAIGTYLILLITSRIYRVGILMYGKRPNLPEIIKWIRYA